MSGFGKNSAKANATAPARFNRAKLVGSDGTTARDRASGEGKVGYHASESGNSTRNLRDDNSQSVSSGVNDDSESISTTSDESGKGGRMEDRRICHNCGLAGHISRNCPDGNDGKRKPHGSRKRDADKMMQKKFYDEYQEMKGKRDADLERIKDLRDKLKAIEDKPPTHAIPPPERRLFDRPAEIDDMVLRFDDKPTTRRRFDCRPTFFAIALSLWTFLHIFQRIGVWAYFTAFMYIIFVHAVVGAVAWFLHRRGTWFEKHASLRYIVRDRCPVDYDDDRRDINTRSLPVLLNDPDLFMVSIRKLKVTRTLFDLLPSVFPDLVECTDPLLNEVTQDVVISMTLFTALRNPRCVVQTSDPKRCLERMQRFAEAESKINIDRQYEADFNVRAATVEFAFAYTYGFHEESNEQVSHRFEPPVNDPNWVGPPR